MNVGRGPRDRFQGLDVKIVSGPHKGHIGIIKDTNGPSARVEVSSKNKIITIELDRLRGRA
jgi:transcription elongation factor SPT5